MSRALLVALVACAVAAPASATESTIYPGVGIGKVKLGMTKTQVERILGKDMILNGRENVAGHTYLELGWNFDSWTVGFLLQNGRYRVVRVGTTMARQRTPTNVGVGTEWLKLVKAYPGGVCTFTWPGPLEYLAPGNGATQLMFTFRSIPPHQFYAHTYVVQEVVVRTRYRTWPEFAPGYEHRCLDGWQSTKLPRPNP